MSKSMELQGSQNYERQGNIGKVIHLELKVSRMTVELGVERQVGAGCHPQWKDDHCTIAHLLGL